jgi:hypothetical protein
MASGPGGGSSEPPQTTYLARDRAQVDTELADRVDKGKQLLGADGSGPVFYGADAEVRFEVFEGDVRNWRRYNSTYLERAFTTREVAQGYGYMTLIPMMLSVGGIPQDRLAQIVKDVRNEIRFLDSLRERLPLYEQRAMVLERTSARITWSSPSPTSSGGRNPEVNPPRVINITFQGQVGQVNLTDIVKKIENELTVIDQRGNARLAEALKMMSEALANASELDNSTREDALDSVSLLAEAGHQTEEERGKLRSRVRAVIALIREAADAAPAVKEAWEAWGPTIVEHFPGLHSH